MKTKLLTICLLLFTSQAFASDYRFNKTVDEFDGSTTQILSKSQFDPERNPRPPNHVIQSISEVNIITVYFSIRKYEKGKSKYFLGVMTRSKRFNIVNEKYAKSAMVLLDGERWNKHKDDIEVEEVLKDADESHVFESHLFSYYKKDFKKLIKAKTFKARVGALTYSIDLSKVDFTKFQL